MDRPEDRLAALEARLADHQAAFDALKAEIAALRPQAAAGTAASSDTAAPAVSRRDLFHGVAAATLGAAATAAASGPAAAANGDIMRYGQFSTATFRTAIIYQGPRLDGAYGFGVTDGPLQRYYVGGAVAGHANQSFQVGVEGLAEGRATHGVLGVALNPNGAGVGGIGGSGDGVRGESRSGFGVQGNSLTNVGVFGSTLQSSGTAIYGRGQTAVKGEAQRGLHDGPEPEPEAIAVMAEASFGDTALSVEGVFRASRSGLAVIRSGRSSTTVPVADLRSTSMVFATIQAPASVTVALNSVSVILANPTRIVLRLSARAPSRGITVAWFVVDRV